MTVFFMGFIHLVKIKKKPSKSKVFIEWSTLKQDYIKAGFGLGFGPWSSVKGSLTYLRSSCRWYTAVLKQPLFCHAFAHRGRQSQQN